MKWFKRIIVLIVLAGLAGGAYALYQSRTAAGSTVYRMGTVKTGDLIVAISATGVVQPEEVIDVGAQVAGQILEFGKDKTGKSIDYRSEVEAGNILAKIDDSIYTAEVAQARAQHDQASASITRATADLGQLNAKLYQADRDWQRAQKLGPSEALSESSYDAYRAAYETAKAALAVGEAAIQQAKGSLASAKATLQRAERNLTYCVIKAPVKGVIIDRRVNIGQTVVSSLNAPSLFLIAKDLRRMEVWVAVNEADVGSLYPGQPVTFTADAFPGETFTGQVEKVRLNATMTQNVVTFTVEVTTDNSSGRLLPYLTANVQFEVKRRDNVMMVPNGALRFTPQTDDILPSARDAVASAGTKPTTGSSSGGGRRGGGEADGGGRRGGGGSAASRPTTGPASAPSMRPGNVWVKDGKYVRPIRVMAGLTDGTMTEVRSKDLTDGMEIVVGEVRPVAAGSSPAGASASSGTSNPFAPPVMRGRGGGGGGPR